MDKEAARKRVAELVQRFERNKSDYMRATYNETQVRTEFITPLLEAFGWDVHNTAGLPLAFREVIEEATVEVGEERLSKKPDYELRLARQRKLFVEAKKPSVNLERDRAPAFQTRRYGYSASLPISMVTNFHQIAIYDCCPVPDETDEPHVARIKLFGYEDYEACFDELWEFFSREVVYSGDFDHRFGIDTTRYGAEQFDDFFLRQVREWRERLAIDIHANMPSLTAEELTYAVQLFLLRIIFLRICEDRNIEKYETLKGLDAHAAFDGLMAILRRADNFYDSGLFELLDDDRRLDIRISDATLMSVIRDLYYPHSPYTFAVVETEVLGEIYEQFLGDVITIEDGVAKIVSKPEVRESGGVVPTPSFIADRIVERTIGPAIAGKAPAEFEGFTVADICCGSGTFLVSAYKFLLSNYLDLYVTDNPAKYAGRQIYDAEGGIWRLTFEEKRRILLGHIRGVDIDGNAVEVTRFSLFLKLIEDESEDMLNEYVRTHKRPVLPVLADTIRCGNSLVSTSEWQAVCDSMPSSLRERVNPFNWFDEFTEEMENGGFNVIIGNPPYIRIQKMVLYSPEELAYYQREGSPYKTAQRNNFDKYALFIERSLSLVHPDGRIGVIVPHKFMTIQAGRDLRELLIADNILEEVVHFGSQQVFGRSISNYTCILIMNRDGSDSVRFEYTGPLKAWRYGQEGKIASVSASALDAGRWQIINEDANSLFARIRDQDTVHLSEVAEISVGVQTSADGVYIIREISSDSDTVTCNWNDCDWRVERGILRPCLQDVELYPYTHPTPNAWVIFPYKLVSGSNNRIRAQLLRPQEIAAQYPGCWDYLCARRTELEARNITGGVIAERQWYQYGRSQSLTKFDRPQIILPVLSREPRYAYDEVGIMFTGGGNGPYYMVRAREETSVSTLYLLAILNHPLSEALVRANTSVFRGGYYSHGKQFIKDLPIPMPEEEYRTAVEAKTRETVAATNDLAVARTPQARARKQRRVSELQTEVEQLVSALFDLSVADIETINNVPVPE